MSEQEGQVEGQAEPCQCQAYLRATEHSALVSARWLGRADEHAAEEAAAKAMRQTLDFLPINGRVVFGSVDDSGGLTPGAVVGSGGKDVDLALDPLEGRGVVARGGNGAISMIVVGEPGKLRHLPDMYMRSIAVGPRARGRISLQQPVEENIRNIAEAYGRNVGDITTIVLDRTRHHDLIEEIRAAGARIKLIQDGTVTAAVSAAIRGTNDHLAIGIGGTRQAVLTAGALRCLGARSRRNSGRRRGARSRRHGSTGSRTSSRCSPRRISSPAR